ncbi:MAG: thioredoxin domain-containing protein [Eubacteriales bacterium]|nr:thioredoxin domain-containing protein [Eubacteriales bacterium]
MSNHLKDQSSPYLLQHAENPVDWFPWGEEAFQKARTEDKPVFLSIGYSTCHWCHVMAHESFEDDETARLLNEYFISIKVDKEERPDIDSIYMSVCQALTGSGGWPMSIFMTPDKKPFYAGTYFPKESRYGMTGFNNLLKIIHEKWESGRKQLSESSDRIVAALNRADTVRAEIKNEGDLIQTAVKHFRNSYDKKYGGFGNAPKFPAAHNLWFLMTCYEKSCGDDALEMAEHTLERMYLGGLFDHIGYGFSRYSTDRYFLVPHFEKMLYDNALLIIAYCKAYRITKKKLYLDIAEKTAFYILREMTSPEGGFYSAQDADSDGEEGKYYVFKPFEIISLLGEKEGEAFNRCFGIDEKGNFEGKNILNLSDKSRLDGVIEHLIPKVYEYRTKRAKLHLDDKILTSWNSLMITAMCRLYRETENIAYLKTAKKAQSYIENHLSEGNALYVSRRGEAKGAAGFIDDYAYYIHSLLSLYEAACDVSYLKKAELFCERALSDFFDYNTGGFYLYGKSHEKLILHPKETYDGAMPSGNSIMAYNLVRLFYITHDKKTEEALKKQMAFMSAEAGDYPAGHAMFLTAFSDYANPPQTVTAVVQNASDIARLPFVVSPDSVIRLLNKPADEYVLLHGKTTFYICRDYACLPPVNDLNRL